MFVRVEIILIKLIFDMFESEQQCGWAPHVSNMLAGLWTRETVCHRTINIKFSGSIYLIKTNNNEGIYSRIQTFERPLI